MSRIFLGPLFHWLMIAVLIGLGWLAGLDRLHVTGFNLFISLVILVTLGAILLVIRTSAPGAQVTRDPLEEDPSE